jgi:hypothetical protein
VEFTRRVAVQVEGVMGGARLIQESFHLVWRRHFLEGDAPIQAGFAGDRVTVAEAGLREYGQADIDPGVVIIASVKKAEAARPLRR